MDISLSSWRYEAIPIPENIMPRVKKHVYSILKNTLVINALKNSGIILGNGLGAQHASMCIAENIETNERYVEIRNPREYTDGGHKRIVPDVPILRIKKHGIFVVLNAEERPMNADGLPLPDYL